jgi:hypothetical protein
MMEGGFGWDRKENRAQKISFSHLDNPCCDDYLSYLNGSVKRLFFIC